MKYFSSFLFIIQILSNNLAPTKQISEGLLCLKTVHLPPTLSLFFNRYIFYGQSVIRCFRAGFGFSFILSDYIWTYYIHIPYLKSKHPDIDTVYYYSPHLSFSRNKLKVVVMIEVVVSSVVFCWRIWAFMWRLDRYPASQRADRCHRLLPIWLTCFLPSTSIIWNPACIPLWSLLQGTSNTSSRETSIRRLTNCLRALIWNLLLLLLWDKYLSSWHCMTV